MTPIEQAIEARRFRLEYDNDTGPCGEGFEEWWSVVDEATGNTLCRCDEKEHAEQIIAALSALRGVEQQEHPLERLTRISEELGLYDDFATQPTAPVGEPPKRLSDDEIKNMRTAARDDPRCVDVLWYMLFARAIESEVLRRGGGA